MEKKIDIPEEIEIEVQEEGVKVKKDNEELEEKFKLNGINIEKQENELKISKKDPKREDKAMIGTIKGKIENAIKGLQEGYTYKLRVIYKHFPINLSVKGNKLKIQNFAGEQKPRYANIVGDTDVKVKGEEIIVKGKNKEHAGQTAANLEQATWIRNKDPRVFEDGIYIIEKPE